MVDGGFGKKRLSVVGWVFLIVGVIALVAGGVTLFSVVNHKIQTGKEKELLAQYDTGGVTEVDGKKVNYKIFNPGKTKRTVVIIPGINEQSAALSSGKYAEGEEARVIVINRPGYALSEETGEAATLEYVVDYYRETLKKLSVSGAVHLLPRASSRMYAEYWQEKYPDEVSSVMSGDEYGEYDDASRGIASGIMARVYNLAGKLGYLRLFSDTEGEIERLVSAGYERGLAEAMVAISMGNTYPDFVVSEGELVGN